MLTLHVEAENFVDLRNKTLVELGFTLEQGEPSRPGDIPAGPDTPVAPPADKPKAKGKPGRKPKAEVAAPVAPPAPEPAPEVVEDDDPFATTSSVISKNDAPATITDLKIALRRLAARRGTEDDLAGRQRVKDVLARYGVSKVVDVKQEHYAAVIADCEKGLK